MLNLEQKIENFSILLQNAAADLGCFFDEESGEGHDMETDVLFCEDVAGWLIPLEKKKDFFNSDRTDEKWQDFFVFAEWRLEGEKIKIYFNNYAQVLV